MDNSSILSHVDHTVLAATTTFEQINRLCQEAAENACASVCIPPCYVSYAKALMTERGYEVPICTVIGFPLGYSTTEVKVHETLQARAEGATEIDIVVNLCAVKNADWGTVESELRALRIATEGIVLKVIIETCYLTEDEKIKLCELVTLVGADYIKTSTGFGSAGATMEDIALFKAHIGPAVKMKASGGIRSREEMVAYLEMGVDRLGTSRAIAALQ